ncbi:MAG: hypothetical protein ACQESP_01200 [Candidatus Muiribacteriota bacterium]
MEKSLNFLKDGKNYIYFPYGRFSRGFVINEKHNKFARLLHNLNFPLLILILGYLYFTANLSNLWIPALITWFVGYNLIIFILMKIIAEDEVYGDDSEDFHKFARHRRLFLEKVNIFYNFLFPIFLIDAFIRVSYGSILFLILLIFSKYHFMYSIKKEEEFLKISEEDKEKIYPLGFGLNRFFCYVFLLFFVFMISVFGLITTGYYEGNVELTQGHITGYSLVIIYLVAVCIFLIKQIIFITRKKKELSKNAENKGK